MPGITLAQYRETKMEKYSNCYLRHNLIYWFRISIFHMSRGLYRVLLLFFPWVLKLFSYKIFHWNHLAHFLISTVSTLSKFSIDHFSFSPQNCCPKQYTSLISFNLFCNFLSVISYVWKKGDKFMLKCFWRNIPQVWAKALRNQVQIY